jgi:hypothetical protein
VRSAFSRVSRERSSTHLSGRPNSSAAMRAATRASDWASARCAQPTPPVKASGMPVCFESQMP